MNKKAGMKFTYKYIGGEDSRRRMELAYQQIFELAWKRLQLESQSTLEYTQNNGTNGRVSNSGGSSGEDESQKDYHLSDVQVGKDSGGEVWEGVADKQQITLGVVPRKGD